MVMLDGLFVLEEKFYVVQETELLGFVSEGFVGEERVERGVDEGADVDVVRLD